MAPCYLTGLNDVDLFVCFFLLKILTLSMLSKNFSRRHFEIFFLFFSENRLTFRANCLLRKQFALVVCVSIRPPAPRLPIHPFICCSSVLSFTDDNLVNINRLLSNLVCALRLCSSGFGVLKSTVWWGMNIYCGFSSLLLSYIQYSSQQI